MPQNKSYPSLSAENYATAPTHGTITHVAIHRLTLAVTAIGLDNEALDDGLGQRCPVPAGVIPEIGKPLPGVEIQRCRFDGRAL